MQFVNWINTSSGHEPANKFTGTQGTSNDTFTSWSPIDSGYDANNPYRNQNAFYFLPTENEWVKAAYWNGTTLQEYATKPGESVTQGDGTSGVGWNYGYDGYVLHDGQPWNVGSGSLELNGTYDMMGDVWEWTESRFGQDGYYIALRGGGWADLAGISGRYADLASSSRLNRSPGQERMTFGFRVASVPEPGSLAMLLGIALTALLYWRAQRIGLRGQGGLPPWAKARYDILS